MNRGLVLGIAVFAALPAVTFASRTCQFTAGPRAGSSYYFPPQVPITEAPLGAPCTDGMGSFGYAIPDQPISPQFPQQVPPQYSPAQPYSHPSYQGNSQQGAYSSGQSGGRPGLPMNREAQISAQCVASNGTPQAAAACMAASLTAEELDKCLSKGIGGDGCFGDNNTLRRIVADNLEAARREKSVPGQVIRGTTGVSVDAIQEKGILGGCNSDLRGILGQKC